MRNPYEVLGVPPNTDVEKCKHIAKRLIAKYHPDLPTGNRELFDEVSEAWKMIKNGITYVEPVVIKRSNLRHCTLFTFV